MRCLHPAPSTRPFTDQPREESLRNKTVGRTVEGLNGSWHEAFSHGSLVVGAGDEFLAHIAALGKVDGVQPIHVVLQRHSMPCKPGANYRTADIFELLSCIMPVQPHSAAGQSCAETQGTYDLQLLGSSSHTGRAAVHLLHRSGTFCRSSSLNGTYQTVQHQSRAALHLESCLQDSHAACSLGSELHAIHPSAVNPGRGS